MSLGCFTLYRHVFATVLPEQYDSPLRYCAEKGQTACSFPWYKCAPFTVKHSEIRWNPELEEWFCVRCGRTSDHAVREDAQVEMEVFECVLPSTEVPEQPD